MFSTLLGTLQKFTDGNVLRLVEEEKSSQNFHFEAMSVETDELMWISKVLYGKWKQQPLHFYICKIAMNLQSSPEESPHKCDHLMQEEIIFVISLFSYDVLWLDDADCCG